MELMPILGCKGYFVPYELVKQHENQVMINHGGQTVDRVCERGGLSWVEMCCVLNDIKFDRTISEDVAKDLVLREIFKFL